MGTTHSSPVNFNQRHNNYNRDPLAYSTNFGTVRFRSNYKPTRCYSKTNRSSAIENNNNNAVKLTDSSRPSSYTPSTKKSRSILTSSWNFVAKRTASAMPSFLGSNNANRTSTSFNSLSSRESSSIKRQSTNDLNNRRISTGRQMSTSSSRDSNISHLHNQSYHIQSRVQEKSRQNLDELNCNVLGTCPEWELADRQIVNNKTIAYSRKKSSQDSLNVFSCRQKYYDEDLTNNNTTSNWPITHSITHQSPQQMPNFITSLDQFANRGRTNKRTGKLEKNHSSLSTNSSEFSSNTASTESTSSFSAYNVANLSIQTKQQLYLNQEYGHSDEDEVEEEELGEIEEKNKSMLRTSYSQQSFLSPSESFDNGVNGNVFGRNVVISSSTSDLLRGLGRYVSQNSRVINFEPASLVMWLRSIDRSLMIQGWQDVAFITAANLVFVYLLIREQLAREYDKIRTINELQSLVCCCLYVSYSYLGNEISYPLKPFISQHENRNKFWSRCVQLINCHSDDMLRVNHSTDFFMELFCELRSYADLER